jgi:8-amino-7-oxononanoate synthase
MNIVDDLGAPFLHGQAYYESHGRNLERLETRSRRRRLARRSGRDFSSNDYLGLASSSELAAAAEAALAAGVPIGAGGSRLLRGNHEQHELVEQEAARLFGAESALYFSTGYAANSALVATLPHRHDMILYDELIHASVHEGLRLSRAQHKSFPHNDAGFVEGWNRQWRELGAKGRLWIVVESLYSMDGDRAPLDELIAIADRLDAILIVDEAHATGVFGTDGRGLAENLEGRANVITVRTCGKALGCEGALICAPLIVRDFLINHGRGFIFSTAPSPLMAAILRAALQLLRTQPSRRTRLWAAVTHAQNMLEGIGLEAGRSQIIPLIVGDESRTMAMAAKLQDAGFDVRGIRPPTVPAGTSRLRISITLNSTMADIDELGAKLKAEWPFFPAAK